VNARKKNNRGRPAVSGEPLTVVSRREALKAAAAGAAALVPLSGAEAARATAHALEALERQGRGEPYQRKYFSADEWRQVRVLVDLVIPADERSGSATQAGVPEYWDFVCADNPNYAWVREALRWLDGFAYTSFHRSFANCTDAERRQLLDQIAWPARAKPELREGVNYFNRLRDFTAAGFFSSPMGVKDLDYRGNVAIPVWPGCPPAALRHLGVSY
jgi:hypothetical protein